MHCPAQALLQLSVGVGEVGVVVDHVLHRHHGLSGELTHAVMVLCDRGGDIPGGKRRLTHAEPHGGPLQPKPRQAEAGADPRKHQLITWIAGITSVIRWAEAEGHRIQGLKEGSRLGGLEPGTGAAGDLTVWDIAVIYLKKVRHTGGGGLLLKAKMLVVLKKTVCLRLRSRQRAGRQWHPEAWLGGGVAL